MEKTTLLVHLGFCRIMVSSQGWEFDLQHWIVPSVLLLSEPDRAIGQDYRIGTVRNLIQLAS